MLAAHGATHVGAIRQTNEDAFCADAARGVFIVADGMGGHNAGEVASRLAVDTVREFLERTRDDEDATWPYGFDPALSLDGNRLVTAIKLANRRIFEAGAARDGYSGMGTTTVAAIVTGGHATFANVGDSRLYLFSGGRLEQLTRDDSWAVEVLARDPAMTPEAIARNPMRHLLTNVVGAREAITVTAAARRLSAGDLLLLCSDGLHGAVPDSVVAEALAASGDLAATVEGLIEQALARGGRDNITAVLVQYGSG